MERVRCLNEDIELQQILENNHDLLPGDQIKPDSPRRWMLIKREMPIPDPGTATDRFSLDFLFADQDAIPTLVECKRFADMRSRREVVGQMIEYAANGRYYWSKDMLRSYAEESSKRRNQTLDESIRKLLGPDFESSEAFFDSFVANLRDGKLRVIFFLDESPIELRSVVDFLSKQMDPTEVLLVEARQYKLNETLIVVPRLFGYTEEARKEIRSASAKEQSGRRQWDEATFFEDAQTKLGDLAMPLRALYDGLKTEEFGLYFGSGKTASFNPKAFDVSSSSPISVYSNGWLTFKFGDLPIRFRPLLESMAANDLGLKVPADPKYPTFYVNEWANKVEAIVKGLVRIIEEYRASGNQSAS